MAGGNTRQRRYGEERSECQYFSPSFGEAATTQVSSHSFCMRLAYRGLRDPAPTIVRENVVCNCRVRRYRASFWLGQEEGWTFDVSILPPFGQWFGSSYHRDRVAGRGRAGRVPATTRTLKRKRREQAPGIDTTPDLDQLGGVGCTVVCRRWVLGNRRRDRYWWGQASRGQHKVESTRGM